MNPLATVRLLFVISALYDGLLGIAFLVAGEKLFDLMGITYPNHWGYVHFPAGMLLIFALMFLAVAVRPVANRNLIPYGILLKLCYASTVIWHWSHGGLPAPWKPFAVIDLLFVLLFVWAYMRIASAAKASKPA